MKIEQVNAKIEASKPTPPPNLTRVLDGEVVEDGQVLVDKNTLQLDGTEDQTDLDYARGLLAQCAGLMEYLHDAKLNSVIEPIDRKELRTLARECRVFLKVTDDADNMNIGGCKFYISSSCIKSKLGDGVSCSACKKHKLKQRMAENGLIPDDADLSERDLRILENIQIGLANRGIDI